MRPGRHAAHVPREGVGREEARRKLEFASGRDSDMDTTGRKC